MKLSKFGHVSAEQNPTFFFFLFFFDLFSRHIRIGLSRTEWNICQRGPTTIIHLPDHFRADQKLKHYFKLQVIIFILQHTPCVLPFPDFFCLFSLIMNNKTSFSKIRFPNTSLLLYQNELHQWLSGKANMIRRVCLNIHLLFCIH